MLGDNAYSGACVCAAGSRLGRGQKARQVWGWQVSQVPVHVRGWGQILLEPNLGSRQAGGVGGAGRQVDRKIMVGVKPALFQPSSLSSFLPSPFLLPPPGQRQSKGSVAGTREKRETERGEKEERGEEKKKGRVRDHWPPNVAMFLLQAYKKTCSVSAYY